VLTGNSVEGGTVRVAIHDSTAVRSDDVGSPFIESDDHIISADDIDAGVVVVPLSEPFTMTPGAYYAGAVMFSNAGTSHFGIIDDLTVPQPPWASNIFIDQTYTNPEALAIRLRSGYDGITENELKGVGVYPNPTDGILNITFTRNDDYTVEVSNILGEVVSKRRVSGTTSMDISEFASGVYNVRVSTDEAATVQRVVKR
jgi:Secretion system C-terminal sorting domain